MRIAEVIAIGDELTSGQRLDTNSQWLSERLGELGCRVMYHTTVADDLEANRRVFETASQRADVVVSTGGLGPTADDLTREALAAAAGVELVLDAGSLEHIEHLFANRGREMPQRNRAQAMFPRGARPIFNPHGTAPGVAMEFARAGREPCRIFALPGVPAEMREMWPAVSAALAGDEDEGQRLVFRHRRVKCFGVGESDLEQMLPDLIRRGREPSVGITVSGATITLRITAAGPTPEACDEVMAPTLATIDQCLGNLVFGAEEDELHHAVAKLLARRRQTLATLEWGTAGQIAHWLRGADEAGPFYLGGLVAGEATNAISLPGLPAIAPWPQPPDAGAIGEAAAAFRTAWQADYALCVGPFPEPAPPGVAPPCFHVALAGPDGLLTKSPRYAGHPDILRIRAAKQALDFVRLALLQTSVAGGA